jgi:hypothetical protein
MADNWYYVQKGNRHGPVAQEVLESMVSNQELSPDDFIWKKGFDNWKKIRDVSELNIKSKPNYPSEPEIPVSPPTMKNDFSLKDLAPDERAIYIRIGNDRGGASSDYGPFSIQQLKQLFKENRVNGKTFMYTRGMRDWKLLGELPEYQVLFQELPPVIKEDDKRTSQRKPFIARLFIQNNKKVFEGICRDISIGGMQVLIDDFKGLSGDKITINVHPENSDYHFTASGVVVRILEGQSGFSFRFQGLSEEAKKSIERYVQEN